MYKCHIFKTIFNKNPEEEYTRQDFVTFMYKIELPFPPYIGLQISNQEWYCEALSSIRWDISANLFACEVEVDYPTKVSAHLPFKELIEDAIKHKWFLSNPEKDKKILDDL